MTQAPEFSQVGTIIEGPTEFFSARLAKKDRKRSFVEEVLAVETATQQFKTKYNDIQRAKTSGKKAHYKKLKAKRTQKSSSGWPSPCRFRIPSPTAEHMSQYKVESQTEDHYFRQPGWGSCALLTIQRAVKHQREWQKNPPQLELSAEKPAGDVRLGLNTRKLLDDICWLEGLARISVKKYSIA